MLNVILGRTQLMANDQIPEAFRPVHPGLYSAALAHEQIIDVVRARVVEQREMQGSSDSGALENDLNRTLEVTEDAEVMENWVSIYELLNPSELRSRKNGLTEPVNDILKAFLELNMENFAEKLTPIFHDLKLDNRILHILKTAEQCCRREDIDKRFIPEHCTIARNFLKATFYTGPKRTDNFIFQSNLFSTSCGSLISKSGEPIV